MSKGKAIVENPLKLSLPHIKGDTLDQPLKEALRNIFPTVEDLKLDLNKTTKPEVPNTDSNVLGETRKERKKKIAILRREKRLKVLEEKNVAKNHVVIGFNDCLRSAQRGKMAMIFVDVECTPPILLTYLLPLCKTQNIDIIGLEHLKKHSTSYFGFQAIIFGFTKCCLVEGHVFFTLIDYAKYLLQSRRVSESNYLEKEDMDKETPALPKATKTASNQSKVEKVTDTFHLKRDSSEYRVFIPQSKFPKIQPGKDFGSDFIVFSENK